MVKPRARTRHIKARLGAFPSGWDVRSVPYMANIATEDIADQLPVTYLELIENYMPDNIKFDQGNLGFCVGWNYSGIIESQATIMLKALNAPMIKWITFVDEDLSAEWVYYWSRKLSLPPVPVHIEGSTNFGASKALHKMGVAFEADVPTDTSSPWDRRTEDTPEIRAKAAQYKIASYHNIPNDPISVKAAIYGLTKPLPYNMPDGTQGKTPIASAYPVYENFKDAYDDGIVPLPSGRLLGGHSSMIAGWTVIDDKEYYINYNSWGKDVGDEGKFYIPTMGYPFYPNDWWLLCLIPSDPNPDPDPDPDNDSTCPMARAYAWAWNMSARIIGSHARMRPVTTRR